MGGGGAMRAVAKAAGLGVVNGGLRGGPSLSPVEHAVAAAAPRATLPIPAMASSSEEESRSVSTASRNNPIEVGVQRPSWELDDWEFAGGEEEMIPTPRECEPMPRLIFGRAPTIEEATEATSELKDALDKVYLSSTDAFVSGDYYQAGHYSEVMHLAESELSETKNSRAGEVAAMPVPKNALKAFRLLKENSAAQAVVASIASDPNVWHAVLQNEALVGFLQSHKSSVSLEVDPLLKESAGDVKNLEYQSPKTFDESSNLEQSADSENGFMKFMNGIKTTVAEMMSSLSDYFHNLFGGPSGEKVTAEGDGSTSSAFVDKTLQTCIMGLAVMAIMVVVLKR